MIEIAYLISGVLLPLFYVPQIIKLHRDDTNLASYSLAKSVAQLLLRMPVLIFSYFVVGNTFMNIVVTADVVGRSLECIFAWQALKRQGAGHLQIVALLNPIPSAKHIASLMASQLPTLQAKIASLKSTLLGVNKSPEATKPKQET